MATPLAHLGETLLMIVMGAYMAEIIISMKKAAIVLPEQRLNKATLLSRRKIWNTGN